MKYLISICALTFSFTSCGGKDDKNTSSSNNKPSPYMPTPNTSPAPETDPSHIDKPKRNKLLTFNIQKVEFDKECIISYPNMEYWKTSDNKCDTKEEPFRSVAKQQKKVTITNMGADPAKIIKIFLNEEEDSKYLDIIYNNNSEKNTIIS